MNRVKRETLENWLKDYCQVLGLKYGYEVGEYFLQKREACYGGGWRIARMTKPHCPDYPFSYQAYTGLEMLSMLQFALRSIKQYQDPKNQSAWAWPREMATNR